MGLVRFLCCSEEEHKSDNNQSNQTAGKTLVGQKVCPRDATTRPPCAVIEPCALRQLRLLLRQCQTSSDLCHPTDFRITPHTDSHTNRCCCIFAAMIRVVVPVVRVTIRYTHTHTHTHDLFILRKDNHLWCCRCSKDQLTD